MDDDTDDFFVDLMDPKSNEVVKVEEVIEDHDLDEDFRRARRNLETIAFDVTEAVADAAILAKQMSEPRGYDALSKIAATAISANKAVVELYKNKVEGKGGDVAPQQVTNNNTIVMTTAEMAIRLREMVELSAE